MLNPEGFQYTGEYADSGDAFLPDWFYRSYSVTDAREDRATVYEAFFLESDEWWEDHPLIRRKMEEMKMMIPAAFGD